VKRYEFALDPVLRVRRIAEDQAKAELARSELLRIEAEHIVTRRERAHSAARLAAGSRVAARSFLAAREQHERTADALICASRDVDVAKLAVEAARRSLVAARAGVAALENLDERRREEHAQEARREETIETDDLVTGRHARRNP
jgi:flagellar export protein FliJ